MEFLTLKPLLIVLGFGGLAAITYLTPDRIGLVLSRLQSRRLTPR
jgi:hypothetical protein